MSLLSPYVGHRGFAAKSVLCATLLLSATLFPQWLTAGEKKTQLTRILAWPPAVEQSETDLSEGIAAFLAFHESVQETQRLVPFSAVRTRLNQLGMSVVTPHTLATKIKTARDLQADYLLYGTLEGNQISLVLFNLNASTVERRESFHLQGDPAAAIPRHMAALAGLQLNGQASHDFFRLWATCYFAENTETARRIMARLLPHEQAGWTLIQEYVSLFGNPVNDHENVQDMIEWRDLFLAKGHYSAARTASEHLLENRHYPADYLVHAGILYRQGELEEACAFVHKADSFGFIKNRADEMLQRCLEEKPKPEN